MPHREELTIDWWRHALEIVPYAAAFVDASGKYLFANQEYCELVNRSEATLRDLRWQDITPKEDLGADQAEVDGVIHGHKTEYYDAKHYLLPSGVRLPVGIWVNRHPLTGAHKGFVVFAAKIEVGATAADVRHQFETVKSSIAILEEQARGFTRIGEQIRTSEARWNTQIEAMNQRFDRLENAILNRQGASVTVGGDYAGQDNERSINKLAPLIILGIVSAVVMGAVIALIAGGVYHFTGGGKVTITAPMPVSP